jgi:hypothetical protein
MASASTTVTARPPAPYLTDHITSTVTCSAWDLAGEAVQALEHAALIRISRQGGGQHCLATRRGRSAAEQGTVEQILAAAGR